MIRVYEIIEIKTGKVIDTEYVFTESELMEKVVKHLLAFMEDHQNKYKIYHIAWIIKDTGEYLEIFPKVMFDPTGEQANKEYHALHPNSKRAKATPIYMWELVEILGHYPRLEDIPVLVETLNISLKPPKIDLEGFKDRELVNYYNEDLLGQIHTNKGVESQYSYYHQKGMYQIFIDELRDRKPIPEKETEFPKWKTTEKEFLELIKNSEEFKPKIYIKTCYGSKKL